MGEYKKDVKAYFSQTKIYEPYLKRLCEQGVDEIKELEACVKSYEQALQPFSKFHCNDSSCGCYNCIAHRLINQSQ